MAMQRTLMQRRKQAAVAEIVSAAIELFSRDGYDETTVDAIVEAAGCSRRTFYRYFGFKEDVLFYDVEDVLDHLARALDRRLVAGVPVWTATCESLIESHFADDRPIQRMQLWLSEPALQARYMEHVAAAERTIVACLTQRTGTMPGHDDLAEIIAIAAVGAYRTSIATHPARSDHKLKKHLRELLAIVSQGLSDDTDARIRAVI